MQYRRCKSSMKVVDFKSLICSQKHTFDFTKQGYVNLMPHPSNSNYNKELFEARHNIIMARNLYDPIHETVTNVIQEYTTTFPHPLMVVDLGCGEGSHLQKIMNRFISTKMVGVGLDISKEGIIMASKRYEKPIWLVGNLAKAPLDDNSFHVILNILSPSNYKEFKRILVQDGLLIKVVPRPNYLKEMRKDLFDHHRKKDYKNDETALLLNAIFIYQSVSMTPLDIFNLHYTKTLNKAELKYLVQMTPLAWTADQARIDAYINRDSAEITVDLDILVGVNK
ncbi:SAM-dependent methyltransferase (plasmid) [Priestia filamentosa]|nr:SAM-dependent methyltransferase [Priestia filamentosa]